MCQMKVDVEDKVRMLNVRSFRETPFLLSPSLLTRFGKAHSILSAR